MYILMRKIFLFIFIPLFLSFCNKDGEWEDPTKPKKGNTGAQCTLLYLYCFEQEKVCVDDATGKNCGTQLANCSNLVGECIRNEK